ncbi:mannitol dehydrogenase family protein [Secundilactobacillus kimchicus]|uniref:Fructuronate reductase n=1 Tax=Secundilactobacillus kimchicus JCM 15530 TaxID=1302272 RepID=A0A0R1HP81_9LACO|nr:mannitol dehydrogenase family protein [Secundilactobacillus kimchicus]KRK48310.1 fructuronate reductase [Secundilactobacillus kimchicus JCM 15530]MBT9671076.1 mannitol dehydrogenase family protein [Secundilactobacillus kimchicus]
MVKITDNYLTDSAAFKKAGIQVPTYDASQLAAETDRNPQWIHFGGGNLFRAFHAAVADTLIAKGELKSGVIVAETHDKDVVPGIYDKYNNRIVRVITKADGSQDRQLFASVGRALFAGPATSDSTGYENLKSIFEKDSLQVASFSITEKGYHLTNGAGDYFSAVANDLKNGPAKPENNMAQLVGCLVARFNKGAKPITLMSTDNFSQNGDRLKNTVITIAKAWKDNGFVGQDFVDYVSNASKVAFPLSMIDRITPNPAETISKSLADDGFEDSEILHSPQHTNIAAFTNTEEAHYLVVEDSFPNGRPAFEDAGVIMTDRDTVNAADEMKVTTCLNPLHTALAVYGSILGYDSIASEMQNLDLVNLIKQIGYVEGLPVVQDPKVIDPKQFIDELVSKRLPNPYIPDTPQRIATDTSQKLGVRYGVTIQHYVDDVNRDPKTLNFIPLVIATWLRYLMGINDKGETFEPSPDPMFDELHAKVAEFSLGDSTVDVHSAVESILSNEGIFGANLYQVGLGEKIEDDFKAMLAGPGAIESSLKEMLSEKGQEVK